MRGGARPSSCHAVGVPPLSTLALFAVAALAVLVIPGPAVLYVVTRSVDQGRRAGIVSVLGLHTGSLVHVAAAATGLSALVLASATAFEVVKLAGAVYLIGLGVARLAGRRRATRVDRPLASPRRIFGQAILVEVLNPKTALFFVAFLPQFVDAGRGSIPAQVLVLGLLFIVLGILSDGTYALVSSALAPRLRRRAAAGRDRGRWTGLVYIGLGITAAVASRPATVPG
jgi:threonine/homoserine/homoserine lactone efflux protein